MVRHADPLPEMRPGNRRGVKMKKGDFVILDYESGEVILTSVNLNEEPEDVFNEYSKSVGHSSSEWMSAPEIKVRW
jgi:hypothetical protein